MILFAWKFSLEEKTDFPDIDFDILQTGEKSYFIMWADETIQSSQDVEAFLTQHFWKLANHDISIESEDALEILNSEYEEGIYESVSFEGPNTSFDDILERFAESDEVIAVREAETSLLYGNKIIKADFIF